jgi:hypothetical protein
MCGLVLRHFIAPFPHWRRGRYVTVTLLVRHATTSSVNRRRTVLSRPICVLSTYGCVLLGHNSDPNSRTAQAACDHTIRHSGSKESVIPRRYWCGELGANGRPEKRRPPRPGSSPDWRPHNRFCVPNYGCRRFACGRSMRRPCRHRVVGEILRFADLHSPMAADARAVSWRSWRRGRCRS